MKSQQIYVLNLDRRKDRMQSMEHRCNWLKIDFQRVSAFDGRVLKMLEHKLPNERYLACAASHLSIYRKARDLNLEQITILEDDVRIHRNWKQIWETAEHPSFNPDLIYWGFVPLSDDQTRWDYNIVGNWLNGNYFKAKNLWGLFGYTISARLMDHILLAYDYSMELDRYFVTHIQGSDKWGNSTLGFLPQLVCHEDGYSDNSIKEEENMIQRTVDTRFSRYHDYL